MTIQQATLEDMPMVEKVHAECFLKDEHFTTLMGEGNNLSTHSDNSRVHG